MLIDCVCLFLWCVVCVYVCCVFGCCCGGSCWCCHFVCDVMNDVDIVGMCVCVCCEYCGVEC